jgi:hypothetical protein
MEIEIVKIQSAGVVPIKTEVVLLFGEHSSDLFHIEGIEETTGLSLSDALSYPETETDGYIYGLVNVTSEGPIFFFTNITRLAHEIDLNGILSVFNYLGHEILHLTRLIQAQAILGANLINGEWPTIGGDITEADTAELMSAIYDAICPVFIEFLEAHTEYGI